MSRAKINLSTPSKTLDSILSSHEKVKQERDLLKSKLYEIKTILKDCNMKDDQALYLIKKILKQ